MKNFMQLLALTMFSLTSFSQEKNSWPRDRYTGPGGGLYTGPCDKPYRSNQPPRAALLNYLRKNNRNDMLKILEDAGC